MSEYFKDNIVPVHKNTIMIHCAATPSNWSFHNSATGGMKEITKWHKDRDWLGNGYAAGVDGLGGYATGRDLDADGYVLEETGAGAKNYNKNFIHLVLFGGRKANKNDPFEKHFSDAQDETLRGMIKEINRKAGRKLKVIGHNDVTDKKTCPGFNVSEWYNSKPELNVRPDFLTLFFSVITKFLGGGK